MQLPSLIKAVLWFVGTMAGFAGMAISARELQTTMSTFEILFFRSLIGAFAMANPTGFHRADGQGYRFVTDWLIRLDALNPQTTARLAGVFESWRRYTSDRQVMMKEQMKRIAAVETLSRNTREIIERILAG